MNIFVLHKNPKISAIYHNDKHVIKMCLETAQLLCTVLRTKGYDEEWMYKSTHLNHPCTIWARENEINFNWLCKLGLELCNEYKYRYGKIHKCQTIIENCIKYSTAEGIPTNFALAMPDYCKVSDNAVECYREYYVKEKRNLASWNGKINSRSIPVWYV